MLSKGSADSFALRNHGMKAMLKDDYPGEGLFLGVRAEGHPLRAAPGRGGGPVPAGADNAKEIIKKAIRAGYGKEYFPALAKVVAGTATGKGTVKKKSG